MSDARRENRPYIYVAWMAARDSLVEALYYSDRENIPDVVNKWFRQHVTEYGQSYTISERALGYIKQDLPKLREDEDKRAMYRLGEKILEHGAFVHDRWKDPLAGEITELRVLVMNFGKVMMEST
jgi:hypothetical protein